MGDLKISESVAGRAFSDWAADPYAWDALQRESRVIVYRPGRTIVAPDQPVQSVTLLLAGSARIAVRWGNASRLLGLARPGSFWGALELLMGIHHPHHVTALESTRVLSIPASAFLALPKNEPVLWAALSAQLMYRMSQLAETCRRIAECSVPQRVALLLSDYADVCGEPTTHGLQIRIRLTQTQIAKDLGVSRKAVAGAVSGFRQQSLIRTYDGRWVLPRAIDVLQSEMERE